MTTMNKLKNKILLLCLLAAGLTQGFVQQDSEGRYSNGGELDLGETDVEEAQRRVDHWLEQEETEQHQDKGRRNAFNNLWVNKNNNNNNNNQEDRHRQVSSPVASPSTSTRFHRPPVGIPPQTSGSGGGGFQSVFNGNGDSDSNNNNNNNNDDNDHQHQHHHENAATSGGFDPVIAKIPSPTTAPSFQPSEVKQDRAESVTSRPTAAPTSTPTATPTVYTTTVAETVAAVRHKATVQAEDRYVRLEGVMDPVDSEETIFTVLETVMQPYFKASVEGMIESFELTIIFLHDYDQLADDTGSLFTALHFQLLVTFYLSSTDLDQVSTFSKRHATGLIDQFFAGTNRIRLMRRLGEAGLRVKDIRTIAVLPDGAPTSAPAAGVAEQGSMEGSGGVDEVDESSSNPQAYPPKQDNNNPNDETGIATPSQKSSTTNVAIYATIASASVVFLAIVFAIVVSKHSQQRNMKSVIGDLLESSPSSRHDRGRSSFRSSSSSGIQPAALPLRRKREELERQARLEAEVASLDGFNYSDDNHHNSSINFGRNFVPTHQPFLHTRRAAGKSKGHNNDDDDDETNSRLGASLREPDRFSSSSSDGLVASGALTCLDHDDQDISAEYPEFEVYSHIPKTTKKTKAKTRSLGEAPASPVWSLSSSSYDYASSSPTATDPEYAAQRRRWHDQQTDDLALVLPDHESDLETDASSAVSTVITATNKMEKDGIGYYSDDGIHHHPYSDDHFSAGDYPPYGMGFESHSIV